jgi:hypothetical protein
MSAPKASNLTYEAQVICCYLYYLWFPVKILAVRSGHARAWTVVASSNAGVVGSNPSRAMDSPPEEFYWLYTGLSNWKTGLVAANRL